MAPGPPALDHRPGARARRLRRRGLPAPERAARGRARARSPGRQVVLYRARPPATAWSEHGSRPPRIVLPPCPRRALLPPRCSSPAARRASAARPREHLADRGHTVYASARRPESIADLERRAAGTLALDVTDEASMREAVGGSRGRARRRRRAGQQRRLQPVGRGGDRPARRGPPPVRDQRLRPRAHVPARAARRCAPQRRADRQHLLDGRELHLPGRRLLPRDQVRGGGDQRRAALRGQGLRRRRRDHPARAHPDRVRRAPRPTAVGDAEAEGPYTSFNARVAKATHGASTRRARCATSAAGPRPWPRRSSARSRRSRPKIRYRVTPSAHAAHRPAGADDGRHVGPLGGDAVPAAWQGLRSERPGDRGATRSRRCTAEAA